MPKTLVFIALLALFGFASQVNACSPAPSWPPSALENFAQKDIAFIGTVSSISQDKSVNGDYRVSFAVDESYKGGLAETVTLLVRSSSAACGYDDGYETFEKGSVWTIFGTGSPSEGYQTDSLSLNAKYKSVADAREALEDAGIEKDAGPIACTMQYAPVCGKDASGNVKTYGNACVLGAEKAEFLYEGECKAEAMPATDLSFGMRGEGVTWLQNFLIEKAAGAASGLLKAVGATGYFGSLTRNALAEYQREHGIIPAGGYFGVKTRAHLEGNTPAPVSFSGAIEAVNTGCFADGICSVTVGGKEVILLAGFRMNVPPVGALEGVDSIGDLENKIGSTAEVYAAPTTEGGADYTLYGDTKYYVRVKAN